MKDVWYQLRILQPLNRTVLEEMAHDAEVLGELLGSEHDLDFLRTRLERESGDEVLARELAQLQKLISKRCKRLRRDAWNSDGVSTRSHLKRSQNASPSSPAKRT